MLLLSLPIHFFSLYLLRLWCRWSSHFDYAFCPGSGVWYSPRRHKFSFMFEGIVHCVLLVRSLDCSKWVVSWFDYLFVCYLWTRWASHYQLRVSSWLVNLILYLFHLLVQSSEPENCQFATFFSGGIWLSCFGFLVFLRECTSLSDLLFWGVLQLWFLVFVIIAVGHWLVSGLDGRFLSLVSEGAQI